MEESVRIRKKKSQRKREEHESEYRECEQFGSSMCMKVIYHEKNLSMLY